MLRTRVIPVLLLQNKGLVKTIKFGNPKYIGDPINAVKIFNDKEADELVFLDIDASKYNRKPDFARLQNLASECFMPLGYGGGITEMDDIKRLFSIGIEKVIINTSALKNFDLLKEASETFGDQSIVLSMDVTKNLWGKYQIYSHSKSKHNREDVVAYAIEASKSGAGEIILNSVDLDGTMKGYDLALIQIVSAAVDIPVVACGGAGNLLDLKKAREAGASAVAAGSLFVFHGPHKAVLINYPTFKEINETFN